MTAVALHYQLSGPEGAPVVVLANSLGATLGMWDHQATAFSQQFRVLRFDHRGHGCSPVPPGPYSVADLAGDLVSLLDRLQILRAHVVGISLGGMVAMWLAAHYPERVDRLGLLCTLPYLPPEKGWLDRAADVRRRGISFVVEPSLNRWFTPAMQAARPATVHRYRAMLASIAAEGYASCCEAIAKIDLRKDLARILAPTLVIAGAQDKAPPPEHARAIATALPRASLAVVADAAHFANVEQPEAVTQLLIDHLTAKGEG